MISIFELEKRGDVMKEYYKLYDDMLEREDFYHYDESKFCSLKEFIDMNIELSPFVDGVSSLDEFITDYNLNKMPQQTMALYICDFILNFFSWAGDVKSPIYKDYKEFYDYSKKTFMVVLKQIYYILELANYQNVEFEHPSYTFPTIRIVKRDHDVDSILSYLDEEPRIRVLSYLDFRVESNVQEKLNIIRSLYVDLEAIGSKLSNAERRANPYSEVKMCLNFARHFREKNISDTEAIEYLDYSFYKFIHYIRENYFKENSHILEAIKKG